MYCFEHQSDYHCFFQQSTLSFYFSQFNSSLIFYPVTSEMDGKTSSGISSTISVPFRPPLPEPPDPSVPSSFLQTHTRPPNINQQARPSPHAYSLPAFTRAHPPALPKIFQPSAGSGIGDQIFLILCCVLSLLGQII